MTQLAPEEFLEISKLPPEPRFEYALEKIIQNRNLWGLYGDDGWLLLKADDDACLPVWPHQEFASAWEKDDFPDCKPKQIALEDWLMSWLPGMEKNGTLILVFPLGEDEEGIMLEASEVLECFTEVLDEKSK